MSAPYVVVVRDEASPAVQNFIRSLQPRRLAEFIGPRVTELTQRHLGKYKNRRGFRSSDFGEQAADHTYWTATDNGVTVVVNWQGAAQLFFGGTIRPVNTSVLVFGVTAESYGKTVYDFGWRRGGKDPELNKFIRENFAFAKSVTQQPHRDFLPTDEEYVEAGVGAIREAMAGGVQ